MFGRWFAGLLPCLHASMLACFASPRSPLYSHKSRSRMMNVGAAHASCERCTGIRLQAHGVCGRSRVNCVKGFQRRLREREPAWTFLDNAFLALALAGCTVRGHFPACTNSRHAMYSTYSLRVRFVCMCVCQFCSAASVRKNKRCLVVSDQPVL